jgi:hypothetical protein
MVSYRKSKALVALYKSKDWPCRQDVTENPRLHVGKSKIACRALTESPRLSLSDNSHYYVRQGVCVAGC